jgi:hypothetical protein
VLCGGEASPAHDRTQATEHIMMVGAWPCRLSSKVHVKGRRVTNPVSLENGKEGAATGQEGEKDPKRACVVTAEGRKVVELRYSELSGIARSVIAKGLGVGSHSRQSDNLMRVARVSGARNSEGSNGSVVAKVGRKPAPQWCLRGISKTQCSKELVEKRDEEERDRWFNH